jgi:hypothetical protein|tara:strand:+ start:325 stop:483 length:159 start_codon:yes stop_codon:yes gene_type:complete
MSEEEKIECKISKEIRKIGVNGTCFEESCLEVTGKDLEEVEKVFNRKWRDKK